MSCAVIRTFLPDLRTLPSRMCATLSFSPITRRSSFRPLNWNDEVRPITRNSGSFASRLSSSSDRPSAKYSWSLLALMSANGSTAMDFGRCLDRCLRTDDAPGAASVAAGMGAVRGMNRSTATTTIAMTEQSDDDEVELAGRLCRDRGVALHLVLALQAFRCQLVHPGENERRHETQTRARRTAACCSRPAGRAGRTAARRPAAGPRLRRGTTPPLERRFDASAPR